MLNPLFPTSVHMALFCWLIVKSLLQDFRIQRKQGWGTQLHTWPAGICSPVAWRWRGQNRSPGRRPCASRPNASLRTKGSVRGAFRLFTGHPGSHSLLLQHGEVHYFYTWLSYCDIIVWFRSQYLTDCPRRFSCSGHCSKPLQLITSHWALIQVIPQ